MGGLHERVEKQGVACLQRSNVLLFVLESLPSCLAVEESFILALLSLPWRAPALCFQALWGTMRCQTCSLTRELHGWMCFLHWLAMKPGSHRCLRPEKAITLPEVIGELSGKGMPKAEGWERITAQSIINFKAVTHFSGPSSVRCWVSASMEIPPPFWATCFTG